MRMKMDFASPDVSGVQAKYDNVTMYLSVNRYDALYRSTT